MNETTSIFLLFILVGGIVLIVMLLTATRGEGLLRMGRAELKIDFQRGNWRRYRPQKHNARAREGKPDYDYWLEVKNKRWRYPLQKGSTVYIGRRQDNQIRLRDRTAATRQAVIYWKDGRFKINNLSRQRPTRVNGRPITMQNIGDGNTIQLGRTKLIFRNRSKR